MKDLPVFTTQYGVASLTLRDVPYLGAAYIKLQAYMAPQKLLEECVSLCAAFGAERIFASGNDCLEKYPLHTAIWRMQSFRDVIGDTDAALWPVQEKTAGEFRCIYNEKVKKLPNAAWMDTMEEKRMLDSGDGYFVHREGVLLGIGRVSGETLRFLAAVHPGAGADVVRALSHAVTGEVLNLEVASVNEKALRLYKKLGFVITEELSRWYRVK